MKSNKVKERKSKRENNPETQNVHEPGEERENISIFQNERLIITLLIIFTALVYFNSLNNQFVYDDWFQIERNPLILSWENAPKLLTTSVWQFMETDETRPVGPYFRPIFSFSLLLNYQLFGFNVVGWHLFSVFLHLATTLLVYQLAQKWTESKEISAIAAFLFGLHPIHTEAVVWASASTELLLGFFTIACLLFYELSKEEGKFRRLWFVLSLISALLAMGSKETGVMIPLFILIREIIANSYLRDSFNVKQFSISLFPYILCSIFYLAFRFTVLGFINKTHPLAKQISNWDWFLTAPYIFIEYIRSMLLPFPMAFVYDYRFINSVTNLKFLISIVLIFGLIFLIYRFGRKSFFLLSSVGLFLVFIFPALNLKGFSPFESILHDRYLYLPSAGFCFVLAFVLNRTAEKFTIRRETVLLSLSIIICLIFGVLTVRQNRIWQNDFILTENALKYAPNWAFLHTHYGEINAEKGNFETAEDSLRRALQIGENPAGTYKSLGYVLLKQKRFYEAEQALKKAIELGQSSVSSWNNLGIALFETEKLNEAEAAFETSLKLFKENPITFYYLGLINEAKGQKQIAEKFYNESLIINPNFTESRLALANLLAKENRTVEAISEIDLAKQKNPDDPKLLLATGSIYLQSKKCQEAVDVLNQYVKKEPQDYRVYMFLGFGYECLENPEMARKSFEAVIKFSPGGSMSETAQKHLENLKDK